MQYIRIKIILQAFTYKIIGLAVIFHGLSRSHAILSNFIYNGTQVTLVKCQYSNHASRYVATRGGVIAPERTFQNNVLNGDAAMLKRSFPKKISLQLNRTKVSSPGILAAYGTLAK